MAIIDQVITNEYALYNGDCLEIMPELPPDKVGLSVYSPPFGGLYNYSSSDRDLSNCRSYEEFFEHYRFIVEEVHRITMPGRLSMVHTMDIPTNGANIGGLVDFSGDIIRLHESVGWQFVARHCVWKEPLGVRNRTMARGLTHKQVIDDASLCSVASADYLLGFRKLGDNPEPVTHPVGLSSYAGERNPPSDVLQYRGWTGNQIENKYSQWVWRQYASAFWDDVRISRVLPYKDSREEDDERHVHPLQLDIIERAVVLRSNPGDVVFTPFMGVGSEVYGAVINDRRAIGVELKAAYYRQAVKNCETARRGRLEEQEPLFADV